MEGSNAVTWRTSSYSGGNGGQCVEVASVARTVLVRDTKNRNAAALSVPVKAWVSFTASLK